MQRRNGEEFDLVDQRGFVKCECVYELAKSATKGDTAIVGTLIDLLPHDVQGVNDDMLLGCKALIEAISELAEEGDPNAIAAVVPYLLLGMGRHGEIALRALGRLRSEEYPSVVASVVALFGECLDCQIGGIEPVRDLICAFLETVPSSGKSSAISALASWVNRTSAGHIRDSVFWCLARLSGQGHGETKLLSAHQPVAAELPIIFRQEGFLTFDPSGRKLKEETIRLLRESGASVGFGHFEAEVPQLHEFHAKETVFSSFKYERRWRKCILEAKNFLAAYDDLVREVVCPHMRRILGNDAHDAQTTFHYQFPPTLRIQPGPSKFSRRMHRDAEYGHQVGEVNFWMPLTDYSKTKTTLWVESEPNLGDFHPFLIDYGTIAMFHGSLCRHMVPPNPTNHTRISMDFRIGIGDFFDPEWTLEGVDHTHSRRTCVV